MASTVPCPDCGAWSAPQATRCRGCGRELRAPMISFDGPPADLPRPRTEAEDKEADERRAAAAAEAMRAQRSAKREEARKRKEYQEQKERLQEEVRRERASRAPTEESPPTQEVAAEQASSDAGLDGARPAIERLPTHVTGLDQALGGGIPTGYVIVIEGAPGTLKSSLGFWIVAHNCASGRRALYVSAEEGTNSLLRQMGALGVDLDAAAKGVRILEPRALRTILAAKGRDWLAPLRDTVDGMRRDGGLDLLVIDSLEALEVLAGFDDRRRELFRLFEWLRDLGLTAFVIAERPDAIVQGNVLQGRYDEDFLADGVLTLRLHPTSDLEVQRRLRIVKMRGTRHETGYLALHVGGGELQVGRVLRT